MMMSNVVSVLILCVYLSQSWQMTCLVLVSFYFWLLYCLYGLQFTASGYPFGIFKHHIHSQHFCYFADIFMKLLLSFGVIY